MTADLEQVVERLEADPTHVHRVTSDTALMREAAALLREQAAEIASLKGGISSLRSASQPGSGGNRDGTGVEPPSGRGLADPLYASAVELMVTDRKGSTSYLQRKFGIVYNRAVALMEAMEAAGIVGPPNHAGKREVIAPSSPPVQEEGR